MLPLMLKGGSIPPSGLWPGLQEGVAPEVWSDYSCHLLPQNLQCGQHMLLPWSHCFGGGEEDSVGQRPDTLFREVFLVQVAVWVCH